jgi:serine phosphatase RsbU (regulator of sigma subunit)
VPRNVPVNLIAVVAVGVLVALIGAVTLSSSQLVNDTVVEQFRSQELQLVSSLAQQTETYFNSLNTEISSLAQQPAINSLPVRYRDQALALMAEHAEARSGVVRSVVIFTHRGDPRYAWPETWQAAIDSGERLPYALPSSLVNQTQDSNYVPLDTQLISASHRDYPDQGTFLLVTPVYNDVRKTDFLVFELNLDELFAQIMSFVKLDTRGQLWVINSVNDVMFQANNTIPIQSLLDKIPLATLFSFRESSIVEYDMGGDHRLAVITPIRTQGNDFAVILSRDTRVAVQKVESDLRRIFLLAAGAIVVIAAMAMLILRYLAREARRRQEEIQRRQTARTLLEVSRALNSTLNLEDVLRSIMAELFKLVPYDSAAVLLLDRAKLVVAAHRGADTAGHQVSELDLDEAHAAHQVIQTGRPLVIHNTLEDDRWAKIEGEESPIRAWMGIPLRVREKTVGVLNINSHTIGRYSPEEIELAEAFADQASVALQNARLHDFEVKQIEQELTIARDIQTSLLPSAAPEIEQLEIVAYSLPARQVSGDYFQYLPMPSGQLGIAVGDVTGKGIPAAMLMAVITTAMRDEAARNARPADLLDALNQRLLERMKAAHVNSALLVGIFDPPTRHLEIANGGMVQPYVRNGKEWSFVPVGGYPLGLSQRMAYESKTITLAPGALLLLMSDGVIETQNAGGEFFGFERLEALLNGLPADTSAQTLIDRIMAAVREHLDGEEVQDDVTILAIRSREAKPASSTRETLPSKAAISSGSTQKGVAEPDTGTKTDGETAAPDSESTGTAGASAAPEKTTTPSEKTPTEGGK